jgi:hypothetical protein
MQLDNGEKLQHGRYIVRYKLHKPLSTAAHQQAASTVHAWTHTTVTAAPTDVNSTVNDISSSNSGSGDAAWCEAGSSTQRDWTEAYRGKARQCTVRGLCVNKEYDVACCIQNEVCITITPYTCTPSCSIGSISEHYSNSHLPTSCFTSTSVLDASAVDSCVRRH